MAFSFGTATGQSKGFSFGTPSAASTTATTGLTLGAAATSAVKPAAGFGSGGFSFGTSATATPATSTGSTFGLGGLGTTTASTGFNFGKTTTTAPTLGGLLGGTTATTSAATSFGFSGLGTGLGTGLTTSTATTTGLSVGPVFANTTQPSTKGLGGTDPQTKTSSTGNGTSNGKSTDSKAIKETNVPNEIAQTVADFKKHVKSQKSVREDISRLSSKPIFKVQEDVQTLRQMISIVSNGLQRNAGAIEKLKMETSQELKNVEISQRTKDTPPGLQYENTAPIEYFQRIVEDFEQSMIQYRQQIENVENHFVTLNQPGIISLQDLTMLLRKLHETFIAFAAQLQAVHEAVKVQKEHYLNYKKVFHGDSTNVFDVRHKAILKAAERPTARVGPTPFSGLTNAAAVAMATALNRGQQPAGAPPTVGLLAAQTTQAPTLGAGLTFGAATTAPSTGFSFGTPAAQTPAFGFGTPVSTAFATSSPFQLQKPPAGSKRGKKN
ncbi:nucleoporin p58/p45-like isoform X2 [Lineus longissimus]|uniref:nucleoporin p58/p45-like isoform X2 n=1 Tax=Lineus longissimus TaxID=88925 RepID=UPI00315C6432